MSTYGGYELLDIRPPRNFDANESVENFTAVVDSKAGIFGVQWMSQAHPWSRSLEWFCFNRTDIQAARDFLYRCQGMYKPFYVPTWAGDFLLTADAAAAATSLAVTSSGRSATETNIAIITPTAVYPNTISSYTGGTLNLVNPIPVALTASATLISYLMLVRLTDDEPAFEYQGYDAAMLPLNFTEIV